MWKAAFLGAVVLVASFVTTASLGDDPVATAAGAGCARCISGKTCKGGYTSGGASCINECYWDGQWVRCSCWTEGECRPRR